jgi:hypothetical protein
MSDEVSIELPFEQAVRFKISADPNLGIVCEGQASHLTCAQMYDNMEGTAVTHNRHRTGHKSRSASFCFSSGCVRGSKREGKRK